MTVSLGALDNRRYVLVAVVWVAVAGVLIVIVLALIVAEEHQPHIEATVAPPSLSAPPVPQASGARQLPG